MDSFNDINILLIEDNDDHIIITKKVLTMVEANCNVKVIKDGRQAIRYIQQQQQNLPNFILLDLGLPGASGLEVLEAFHYNYQWAGVPIWLLTTFCEDYQLEKAVELGIEGYIEKPLGKNGMNSVKKLFTELHEEITARLAQ